MTRQPRPSTPHPTLPPPARQPDDQQHDEPSAVHRVVAGIEPWKAILGILVTAIGVGATGYAWLQSKADVAQVELVRDGAAAALGSAQATATAQLGTLQATVQDLRARQAAVDASLAALTSDVSRLQGTTDGVFLQLIEIARVTGARQVPAAPPPERTTP